MPLLSLARPALTARGGSQVSYEYSDATMWKLVGAASVAPLGSGLTVTKSPESMCLTAPKYGIKTPCFPFQLHAVAPVAANGWALIGEADKFVPVSNQRLASVKAGAAGFELGLKGAAGETVTMGAVDAKGGKAPVFKSATIGADGTATLQLP